jgi:hypothetical protein
MAILIVPTRTVGGGKTVRKKKHEKGIERI